MTAPKCVALICTFLFLFGSLRRSDAIVVNPDDCTESGSHAYHAHSSRSASYSSGNGYSARQQHPTANGYSATSSQYVRSGSSAALPVSSYSAQSAALNTGYKAGILDLGGNDGDLQVATSYYSPTVTKFPGSSSNYQSGGGYGLHHPSTSSNYNSNVDSQVSSSVNSNLVSNYGGSRTGYGGTASGSEYGGATSGSGYGANSQYTTSNSGYGNSGYGSSHLHSGSLVNSEQTSTSHVRQKFEDLKQKADSFVHHGAPPPVGITPSLPLSSTAYGTASQSSSYQRHGSNTGSADILGVSYGTTGVENEDDYQKLVPVTVSLPPSSSALVSHKENQNSHVSYSTSGSGIHSDGVDFSLSGKAQSIPVTPSVSSSYESNAEGTSTHVTKDFEALKQKAHSFVHEGAPPPSSQLASNSLQQSTYVETLPARPSGGGTITIPVKVTVTRQEILPGTSGQNGVYGDNDLQGSSSVVSTKKESYSSHSSSASTVPQTVSYQSGTIGTAGKTSGTTSYSQVPIGSSSSYSYHAENAGGKVAPQLYTVGPQGQLYFPENTQGGEKSTGYGSGSSYSKTSNVHREIVQGAGAVPISNPEDFNQRSNKLFDLVSGYGTFLLPKESESSTSAAQTSGSLQSTSINSQNSQNSQSGSGYSSGYASGYQGVGVPSGTVKKTSTVYSSYNSNSGAVPTHLAPGVPIGDPVTPPEVTGSYFVSGKNSKYGQGSQTLSSGYGTRGNQGYNQVSQLNGYSANRGEHYNQGGQILTNGQVSQLNRYSANGAESRNQGSQIHTSGYGANANIDQNYGQVSHSLSSGYNANADQKYGSSHSHGLGVSDLHTNLIAVDPNCKFCDDAAVLNAGASTGGVKKYGISSSWSSKSQTVNGKTTESKQAQVTVNDNGKIDTYATHN